MEDAQKVNWFGPALRLAPTCPWPMRGEGEREGGEREAQASGSEIGEFSGGGDEECVWGQRVVKQEAGGREGRA